MNNDTLKLVITIASGVLSLVTGIILTVKGSPYPQGLTAVHKILTLVMIVFLVVLTLPLVRQKSMNTLQWSLLIGAAVTALLSIASGAVLSGNKVTQGFFLTTHRISPWLTYILSGVYLFLIKKG